MKKLFQASVILIFVLSGFIRTEAQVKPVFKNGMTVEIDEFKDPANWIREDLFVETEFDSDGDGKLDRVHVDVTRPKQTEEGLKLPVIYESSPYYSGTGGNGPEYFWNVEHEIGETPPARTHFPPIKIRSRRPIISNGQLGWVAHGYVVVHSESPGTGYSQGCPTVGADNESLAPKAVIDWLNGRAKGYKEVDGDEEVKAFWSTGKVGMTGTSYNGTLPLAAATTGVDGLEVIIPIAPNTSYYHYYRSNGLVRSPGGYLGEDIDVLYGFIHSSPYRKDWCDCNVRDEEMAENQDRITGDYSDWWAGRDYLNDMDGMKCALLMAHGFNDWNVVPEHSYRIYKAAKEKGLDTKIYYHQGGHGGQPPMEMMNKWFAKYLHGVDNDVLEGPNAFIVREDADRKDPTPYADYPNPDASQVTFYLQPGAPKVGALTTNSAMKAQAETTETLVDNVSFSGETLAQAENTEHRLLYVTPVLKEDIHISGLPSITIKAASSKPAVNLSVWLVSLPWTNSRRNVKITDNIIDRGWADLQNYKSLRESEPLVPGQFYEMTFNLQPDDQVIKAGQQIGLMIFSSDRDFTLWPEPGTELTVDLGATKIDIPIVGGLDAFERAIKED